LPNRPRDQHAEALVTVEHRPLGRFQQYFMAFFLRHDEIGTAAGPVSSFPVQPARLVFRKWIVETGYYRPI
jgi:hypothetical protein